MIVVAWLALAVVNADRRPVRHSIVAGVPSLFTFKSTDQLLKGLEGIVAQGATISTSLAAPPAALGESLEEGASMVGYGFTRLFFLKSTGISCG